MNDSIQQVIFSVPLRNERDVVRARQRAREIARMLGFDAQDQIRLATGTSEIARNAFRYAREAKADFMLELRSPQKLIVIVKDHGKGIQNLEEVLSGEYRSETGLGIGVSGTKRLMDTFAIHSDSGGTEVVFGKEIPKHVRSLTAGEVARLRERIAKVAPSEAFEEVEIQNRELMRTLEELRARQEELSLLNRELEDTNRGVVALYAELDERADYLRRVSDLKTSFLSNMSHEFRTPLNSIISLARILQQQVDGPVSPEQEKQIHYILKSAMDLSDMVNDLLEIARVEAGKVKIRAKQFEVADLFGALRGMLRPLLVGTSVDLIFAEPQGLAQLHTDEGKVSQILRNFISNALKFTTQGEVRVSAHMQNEETVVFAVADTGIGIAPENIPLIFREFGQVEGPLQEKARGTGLGLPLCRNLAQLLGGNVTVESEVGKGSTFYAYIPIRYKSEQVQNDLEELQVDPARVPVLIVEDNNETLFLYGTYLRGTEFQAIGARTLDQARTALRSLSPAVIVLDVFLYGQTTYEFIAELKAADATAKVPLLVASVTPDPSRSLIMGAEEFLPKPVEAETLLGALRRHTLRRSGKKVLLVDDNEISRYVLREHLQGADVQIFEAKDGREALRIVKREHPDLILLDLLMPEMSGFDFLRELRANENTRAIPVIVCTSKLLDDAEKSELMDAATAIVPKSVLDAGLGSELDRAIAKTGVSLLPS
jgi:signal transduction histidine kinase/CheY-like chemotaxis protein/anti-sigma regulatory factor (Ser/Thr protein kinase)